MSRGNSAAMPVTAACLQSEAGAESQAEVELLKSLIEIIFKPNLDSVSESEILLLESLLPAITEEMIRLKKELLGDEIEA